MRAVVASLLSGAFRRLFNPGISMLSLALLVTTSLMGVLFTSETDVSAILPSGVIALITPVAYVLLIVLMLVAYWRLTRETADIQGRRGAVGPWLGWTLLAYLPAAVAAVAFAFAGQSDPDSPLILESAVIAFLQAIAAPLFVHGSGRAIDAAGSDVGDIWAYWERDYPALVVAFLLIMAPFTLIGDLITQLAGDGPVAGTAAALTYLIGSILGTLLSVEAFQRVPHKAHG